MSLLNVLEFHSKERIQIILCFNFTFELKLMPLCFPCLAKAHSIFMSCQQY